MKRAKSIIKAVVLLSKTGVNVDSVNKVVRITLQKQWFEKTISGRDHVQKLRDLAFLIGFYSVSFFGKKTLSSRKKKYKVRQRVKNVTSDPIRSIKTVLFRRTCLITTVFVERIACGR